MLPARCVLRVALLTAVACSPPVPEPADEPRPPLNREDPPPPAPVQGGVVQEGAYAPPLVSVCPRDLADPSPTPFVDVTACAGITAYSSIRDTAYFAIGQAWGDYDADGLVDLYLTDEGGPNALYRNAGDGTFEVSPLADHVALPEHSSAGAVFADYDNDGFRDLYVLGYGANHLFHNEGGTGFVDVTARAGVDDHRRGQTASFGDYDRDGYLDLYVANYYCSCDEDPDRDDRLYHNEGDGTFSDATHLLGGFVGGLGFAASFIDYDNDGDLDIYLANDQGLDFEFPGGTWRNVLWRNDGAGCMGWCFTEVAIETGADARIDSMGLAVGDYDNDGDLDFFVSNSPPHQILLRNDGPGTFVDMRGSVGLEIDPLGQVGWGTVFLDYDNDGFQDIYLDIGGGPNRLFRNLHDGAFEDVSEGSGADDPDDSLGVAYSDYDRDGRVDLIVGNRGWDYRLYRNVGSGTRSAHWLALRLVGAGPVNRDAIGARAYVHTTDGQRLMREIKCGSSLGAGNDLTLYFGLGDATLEEVEIVWPDGTTSVREDIAADHTWVIAYPGS